MIASMKWPAAVLAAVLLAGCGGGSKSVPLPPASPALSGTSAGRAPSVATAVKLTIPAGRKPSYVSPSTAGVSINAYGVLAGPSAGLFQAFDLTTGCTQNPDGSKTCTLTVNAPVGNDEFAVTAYDASPGQCNGYAAPLPSTCHILSAGTALQTIAANASNTIALAMGGTVASLVFAPNSYSVAASPASHVTLALEALDAGQNIILGTDAYANPITATIANDPGNDFTFTNGTHTLVITAPPSSATPLTVTVNYDGTLQNGLFTVTATTTAPSGTVTASASLGIAATTGVTIPGFPTGGLAVAQSSSASCGENRARRPASRSRRRRPQMIASGPYEVDVYPPNTAVPLGNYSSPEGAVLTTSYPCSFYPVQIAFDAAGDIFVGDSASEQVDIWYASTLSSLVADYETSSSPDATITGFGDLEGVAADASGHVYVADDAAATVTAYGPPSYATPLYTLSDPSIGNAVSLAVDPSTSDLLVATCVYPDSTPCGTGYGAVSSYQVGSSTPAGTLLNAYPAALSPVPLTIGSQVATGSNAGNPVVLVSQFGSVFSGTPNSPLVGIAGATPQTYAFSPPALAVQGAGNANLAAYDSALNIALSTWDAGTSMWEVQFFPPASTSAILQSSSGGVTGFGYIELAGQPVSLAAVPATVFADFARQVAAGKERQWRRQGQVTRWGAE